MRFTTIFLRLFLWLAILSSCTLSLQQASEEESTAVLLASANKLKEAEPKVSSDDALAIAQLLQDLAKDEETEVLVNQLRNAEVEQDPIFKTFLEEAGPKEIVQGLNQILDELKALEVLFRDPQRAVEEFHKDGMIEAGERLEAYRENPAILEQDVRSGLFFSFVSFAVAGNFL